MQKHNKRIVVKIGTKVLTSGQRALDTERMRELVRQIAEIKGSGVEVVLVTSGAIGAGMPLLGMKRRPTDLACLQAAAAIGQSHLMRLYSKFFQEIKKDGPLVGQILLTQEDFNDRKRFLNIKHTINALLAGGAVPIINENDTVATDEIRCGDNDRLSALVADLCGADKLILLTDVDGLLDEDGAVITEVSEVTAKISKLGGKSHCDLGTGGMASKLDAAKTAARAGIECVIANGRQADILVRVMAGERVGTTFACGRRKFIARKRWIAFSSKAKGLVMVDDGAKRALLEQDKSLLASGVIAMNGNFRSGDVVAVADSTGAEFARGLVNYSSAELAKIKGLKTGRFREILGYSGRDEVIHKDNLAIEQMR